MQLPIDEEAIMEFIAFDWCGWNERYGRFTHMPSGDTCLQPCDADQRSWDKKQLEWFKKYPGIKVCRCLTGPYVLNDNLMGTTDEICDKLKQRLV